MKKSKTKNKSRNRSYQILVEESTFLSDQQKINQLFKKGYQFEYLNDSLQGAFILAIWKTNKNNAISSYRFTVPYRLLFQLRGNFAKRWQRAETQMRKRETTALKDWMIALSKLLRKKSTFAQRMFDVSRLSDVYSVYDNNVRVAQIDIPSKNNSYYEKVVRKSRQKKINKTKDTTFSHYREDLLKLITKGKLDVD